MESRWHVPAGKILEETRIEDRKHALHIARDNWSKITLHLDRKKIIAEAREQEENHKKALKAGSDAMTQNWDNSVENIHKRQEEQRIARSEVKAAKQLERYMELKKIQAEERKNYIEHMRERLRMKMDYPKTLHSALMICEGRFENERLQELQAKIKQHHAEETLKYEQLVAEDVLAAEREKAEAERKNKEKNDKYANELKEQINEIQTEKERERAETLRSERLDYIRSVQEMQKIEEVLQKKAAEKRLNAQKDMIQVLEEKRKHTEKLMEEEKQIDIVVKIIEKTNKKIECIKTQKLLEDKEERMRKSTRMGLTTQATEMERARLEEERLHKRQIEAENQYQEKKKNEQAKKDLNKKNITEGKLEADRRKEAQRLQDLEVRKWDMLNRFKTTAEDEKFREGELNQKREEKLAQKKEWDEQIAENNIAKQDEKAMERKEFEMLKEAQKSDDTRFLEYANKLIKTTKERGRMTYPMEKVVVNYKKNMMGERLPGNPCEPSMCRRNCHKELVNTTPGKLAHKPDSDPTFTDCRCKCHKNVLYQ